MKATVWTGGTMLWAVASSMAAWLCCSCGSTPVRLSAVGPQPPAFHSDGGQGYLVVYSDTEAKRLDKGLPFYVHSSYVIERQNGTKLKWVPNHVGDMDQAPERVRLPAGTYDVVARSTAYGRIRVPVVIEAGRTTEVHLGGDWKPALEPADASALVRLPNQEIVGWRASAFARE